MIEFSLQLVNGIQAFFIALQRSELFEEALNLFRLVDVFVLLKCGLVNYVILKGLQVLLRLPLLLDLIRNSR